MCKLAAVLQGKCTSVLAETQKNAHAQTQSNAVSFAVTIFLSGLTGSELRLFKNLSQSVSQEKIDKIAVPRIFCFYSIVVLECFYGLLLHNMACLSVDEVNGAL